MKWTLLFAGTFLLAILSGSGFARGAFIVNVFENGTLTYSINGGPLVTVHAVFERDPTAGEDARLVPTFRVADQAMRVMQGDLILDEPEGGISDVLRFLNPNAPRGPSELLFYSDVENGEAATTFEVGLPLTKLANFHNETETGPPDGNNGFTYTPTPGQPGYFLSVPNNITYIIHSDSIGAPEIDPGSMAGALTLLSTGVLMLTSRRRRSQPLVGAQV
jgi:hypothetical protein